MIKVMVKSKADKRDRERDRDNALNWLRNEGVDHDDEGDSAFAQLDLLLPKKVGQSHEDRANEMESALNWLRDNGLDIDGDDGLPSFEGFKSLPVSTKVKAGDVAGDEGAVLSWLRSKKNPDLDPTGLFRQIDASLPKKKGQSKQQRAKDIVTALFWMRNKGLVSDVEDDALAVARGKQSNKPGWAKNKK